MPAKSSAGVSECLLVNLEIFDGLNKHFVVRINGGCEAIGIQQTFLGPSDDVQDVRLFIPPHSARTEDLPLLGGIPKLKPPANSKRLPKGSFITP